jgi:hypothetical protein
MAVLKLASETTMKGVMGYTEEYLKTLFLIKELLLLMRMLELV